MKPATKALLRQRVTFQEQVVLHKLPSFSELSIIYLEEAMNKKLTCTINMLLGRGMLALSMSALAAPFETDISRDSVLVLGEVTVTAPALKNGPLSTSSVLSSVDILESDKVEQKNVQNSWQLFGQMPGIQLTEFKQGAESGKLSFRAFNGEGEINAIKLLLDGIPSNTNDGNMRYLDMIFPLEIEALEVVRGTNDPRYGLHNIAGNVNVVTKQGGNYTHARASYGSFNSREAQVSTGIESNGLAQNYFAAWQLNDGYRDHADSNKYSLAGKWFFTPNNDKFKLGVVARHYHHAADEPGYLTLAESRADDEQSRPHNATDGDKRYLDQLSGHLDASLSDTLAFSAKAYLNRIDDTRWVTFSATQAQQERVTEERHTGLLSTLTWRPEVTFIHDLAIEGGLSREWQDNESRRYTTANRVRTANTRNQQFDVDMTGGYVEAVIKPVSSLKIVPAYRLDQADGSYTNLLNGRTYSMNDYGTIRQPKLSVVYSPVDAYSVYGNWGRTFQIGVGTAAYKVNQTADLEPSINEGWELGVKFNPVGWMDGRIAIWEQTAENEARRKLGDPANDSENIGKTRRNGVDFQVNLKPTEKLNLWAAYSWQDSKILQADAATPTSQGKEIDHVPNYIFSGGADYQLTSEWRFGLTARGQGASYLERTNATGRFGQYTLFDASASYQWNERISVDMQIKNLADRYYEYVWWNTTPVPNQSSHAPGDGRALYLGVNLKL